MHYVEIGNEDFLDKSGSYEEWFTTIASAIRAKYPQLKLIATMPVKSGNPDIIDDHYYQTPEEFSALVHKYDTASRSGPKVFIGEWATRTGAPTPDFGAALGDAAWMTSMERNSDLIVMSSYAPLLTNVNSGAMQWVTDLIGYDSLRIYKSPAYWAQVMFAQHVGDHTVSTTSSSMDDRVFWSATTSSGVLHLKLVNATDMPRSFQLNLIGARPGPADALTLHAETKWATNTIDRPVEITPKTASIHIRPGPWSYSLLANTIQVIEVGVPGLKCASGKERHWTRRAYGTRQEVPT